MIPTVDVIAEGMLWRREEEEFRGGLGT
jgi:hypothetical protein